jgi:predicted dehydrogenase
MNFARFGAIVGFGNVAVHGHLPAWKSRRDFEIRAVVDAAAERRALASEQLPGVAVHASLTDLLGSGESLDFVDLATPPAFHAADILAAARADLHVLCEKPLTTSVHEYIAVRKALLRSGTALHVVHNWKFSEAFRAVQRVLRDGRLGKLQRVVFETKRDGFAASRDDWRLQPSVGGGGILVDHGWHNFYLLLALANAAPQRIRATIDKRRYVDADVEDTASCEIEFPSMTAEVHLTWAASERRTRWELIGSDGRLLVDDDRIIAEGRRAEPSRRLSAGISAGSHHPEWFPSVIDSFRREMDDTRVRGESQREAEWCLQMLHLAYASAAQGGQPLEVLPLDEAFAEPADAED